MDGPSWNLRFSHAALAAFVSALICAFPAKSKVSVSTAATENMNCSGGVCTPTAPTANLNVGDLTSMLASGDVKIVSDATGQDIELLAPLSWTSSNRLALDSYHSVSFNQPIAVAGSGALTITTNEGGTDGDFVFTRTGHVEFWDLHSSLVINANTYALVNDVNQLAAAVEGHPSGFFALAQSHDSSKDGTYHKPPVATYLSGTFEGLGNTITGLTIANHKELSNVGLFARIAFGGIVRDVRLAGVKIRGKATSGLGALAGDNWGSVENAEVSGRVTNLELGGNVCAGSLVGSNENRALLLRTASTAAFQDSGWEQLSVGGLAGCNDGTVRSSVSDGSVKSNSSIPTMGGLVGKNATTGVIASSSASGEILSSQGNLEGGLVGQNEGTVQSSSASGKVNGCSYCGGLIGINDGTVVGSYATGKVTFSLSGANSVGGLVAVNTSTIKQSWASGNAVGGQQTAVGGLIGNNSGSVEDSYAFGSATAGEGGHAGGLLGYNTGYGGIDRGYSLGAPKADVGGDAGGSIGTDFSAANMAADYWDMDTSGITDPHRGAGNEDDDPGIIGLSDAQLKATLPVGFDPKVWGRKKKINNGYPYLLANPPPK